MNLYHEQNEMEMNFKHYNLSLTQAFLYLEFLFVLWIHLSFVQCGLYMDLWICGIYTNICSCAILAIVYKKYKIHPIFESALFFYNIVWFVGGLFFIKNVMYNLCIDDEVLISTSIFYLMTNIMITFVISSNRK